MAMASTTSAAANMLLSGSMSSADGLMNPNFLARAILPCSPNMATISASPPFPTVTLDLTQNANPLQFPRPQNQFQVPFAAHPQAMASMTNTQMPQIFGQALYNQSKFSGLQVSQDIEAAPLSPSVFSDLKLRRTQRTDVIALLLLHQWAPLKQPTIKVVAIIDERVLESDTKQLITYARPNNKVVIGPATIRGIQAGAFKIGDTVV